jgi:hypothetical protein
MIPPVAIGYRASTIHRTLTNRDRPLLPAFRVQQMSRIHSHEQLDSDEFCSCVLDQPGLAINASDRGMVANVIEWSCDEFRLEIFENFTLFIIVVKRHTCLEEAIEAFIARRE